METDLHAMRDIGYDTGINSEVSRLDQCMPHDLYLIISAALNIEHRPHPRYICGIYGRPVHNLAVDHGFTDGDPVVLHGPDFIIIKL